MKRREWKKRRIKERGRVEEENNKIYSDYGLELFRKLIIHLFGIGLY
jgi:hypothetical protein